MASVRGPHDSWWVLHTLLISWLWFVRYIVTFSPPTWSLRCVCAQAPPLFAITSLRCFCCGGMCFLAPRRSWRQKKPGETPSAGRSPWRAELELFVVKKHLPVHLYTLFIVSRHCSDRLLFFSSVAMRSFVAHCPELLTEDVIRRLMTPIECAMTMMSQWVWCF